LPEVAIRQRLTVFGRSFFVPQISIIPLFLVHCAPRTPRGLASSSCGILPHPWEERHSCRCYFEFSRFCPKSPSGNGLGSSDAFFLGIKFQKFHVFSVHRAPRTARWRAASSRGILPHSQEERQETATTLRWIRLADFRSNAEELSVASGGPKLADRVAKNN
jgi:hypothetical protein